jgi:hypothetical protein
VQFIDISEKNKFWCTLIASKQAKQSADVKPKTAPILKRYYVNKTI